MKRSFPLGLVLVSMILLTFSSANAALLIFTQIIQHPDLAQAENLVISPDGKYIYVTGYGTDSLVLFERENRTGNLIYIKSWKNGDLAGGKLIEGLNGANGISISPDGNSLYITGYWDQSISVFARDARSGMLQFVQRIGRANSLTGAAGLVVSPDGRHVYVTANRSHALVVFERDYETGMLTYLETKENLLGLGGARNIVITNDGEFLYASGQIDDGIIVFSRDKETGILTHIESIFDNQISPEGKIINGLNGAYGLTLSVDNQNLYVSGFEDAAIAVFSRNELSGKLTFLESERNGVDDPEDSSGKVSGLRRPMGLTTTPDGEYLLAIGNRDNSLVLFQRIGISGRLQYIETLAQTIDPVDGLARPKAVISSPDGSNIYVLSNLTETISVFIAPTSISEYKPEAIQASVGQSSDVILYGDWSVILQKNTLPDGSVLSFQSVSGAKRNSLGLGMTDMGTRTELIIIGPDDVKIDSFSPKIGLCLKYNFSHLWAGGNNPNNLILGRKTPGGSTWDMLDTYNTPAGQICAETDSTGVFEIFIPPLPNTGIAPGHSVSQPADIHYQANNDLKLVISKLDIEAEIVGVSLDENGWQTDWLGTQVGFLNGTAFPTWSGNTVLTAHAWLGNTPGPFNEIEALQYGDQFSIHAWGRIYNYEVREILIVPASEIGVISKKEYDWVTLITCRQYDTNSRTYLERLAVRAILVNVDQE